MKTKTFKNSGMILILTLILSISAYAHCEIPCGIYGDAMRVTMIREHVETIEKSMTMIDKLSQEKKIDYNQLVRWVNNKEEHANMLQDIATQYFMFQRIKPVKGNDSAARETYLKQLELMHGICISAMKCKQGTDKANTRDIISALDEFEKLYFHDHDK
jgi:nickel superoxide dismutase